MHTVHPDEELCIFYGHRLWFTDASERSAIEPTTNTNLTALDDGFGWLRLVHPEDPKEVVNPYLDGDGNDIIPDDQLPFARTNVMPDTEEDEDVASFSIST